MKVLYIMNQVDYGGAALAFIELVVNMKKMFNIESVVLTGSYNKINKLCEENNIENHVAHFRNYLVSPHRPEKLWILMIALRNRIGSLLANFEIRNININSFDIIHTNLDRIDFGAELSKKYGIMHVWHLREHLDTDFKIISFRKNYVNYIKKFDSEYIAISNSVRQKWIERGLDDSKINLIYDGVEIERIRLKTEWFKGDKVHLLFIGGITKNKGQNLFLSALSELEEKYINRIDCTFFGNGSNEEIMKLKKIAYNSNLECYFEKYTEDIYSKISEYDIGITYSLEEGFGRVTVEYMAAGLCVVATKSGANTELIEDAVDGFLVDRNNYDDLQEVIRNLINNPQIVKKIGKQARKKAQTFSMGHHVTEVYHLYQRILGE